MDNDLNTLATTPYVTTDDYLNIHPEFVPVRPRPGNQPRSSGCEIIVPAIMETLLGFTSERRFIRYIWKHLTSAFPYIPQ